VAIYAIQAVATTVANAAIEAMVVAVAIITTATKVDRPARPPHAKVSEPNLLREGRRGSNSSNPADFRSIR